MRNYKNYSAFSNIQKWATLRFLPVFLLIFLAKIAWAQPSDKKEQIEKLKAIKVGMIVDRLELGSDQAKVFWPVYEQYENERRQIRHEIRKSYGNNKSEGDRSEIEKQDEVFALRQKELDLAKKYRPEFLKTISPQQFSELLEIEREFKEMILKELGKRKHP